MTRILITASLIILFSTKGLIAQPTAANILTQQDKTYLLNLARQTVFWHLKYKTQPKPVKDNLSENIRQHLGCFVTLQNNIEGLRGCIGIFERRQPLYENVISRAIAATHDSRFRNNPVTIEEMKDIKIEISVLTEPEDLDFDSPEDLLAKIRPSIDGLILYTKYGSSTYLPQVWGHFSKKEDFISHLCRKHRAPMDVWRKDYKNIRVQTYQAIVFGEESSERKVIGPKGARVGKGGAMFLGTATPSNSGPGIRLKQGAILPSGAIVTWTSDIHEPGRQINLER